MRGASANGQIPRSFPEIWDGTAYREFRAALLTPAPPDVCRGCAMYRRVF